MHKQLYTDQTDGDIRARFIQKFDDLITAGRAASYKEICDNIDISTASFNQVKSGKAMPTNKMYFNLQSVYKISAESILFNHPPKLNLVFIRAQLSSIQEKLEEIDAALSV